MILLGICGALNNSEVAGLETECVTEIGLDFRRRKTGKVRRVIPLPAEVLAELHRRPPQLGSEFVGSEFVFLTEFGLPYVRMSDGGQVNDITLLFSRLATDCGVKCGADGKGFAGLRTTFCNLSPPGYRDEVEIITGHALGTVLLDNYLEDVGTVRLAHVVNRVWGQIRNAGRDARLPFFVALDASFPPPAPVEQKDTPR